MALFLGLNSISIKSNNTVQQSLYKKELISRDIALEVGVEK